MGIHAKTRPTRRLPASGRLACLWQTSGVFHHILIRGIERREIFKNNKDRDDFFNRLSHVLPEIEILRPSFHAQRWLLSLIAIKQSPLFFIYPIASWTDQITTHLTLLRKPCLAQGIDKEISIRDVFIGYCLYTTCERKLGIYSEDFCDFDAGLLFTTR